MTDFAQLAAKSKIPLWYFEVVSGRPLMRCTLNDVQELGDHIRLLPSNSEEEHAGFVRLHELLTPLAEAATTNEELLFVRQNCLQQRTHVYELVSDKLEMLENAERHRRLAKIRAVNEAGLLKQLELSPFIIEMWEVVMVAQNQSTNATTAALDKIVLHATSLQDLVRVHELSLFWQKARFSSVRKIISLENEGVLTL